MARRRASHPWTNPQSPQYRAFYHALLGLNREKSFFFARKQKRMRKGAEWMGQPFPAGHERPAAGSEAGHHSGGVVASAVR